MHQSFVHVSPPSDNTRIITRSHAAYDFLCDTSFIVNISFSLQEASMTNNKHGCAPLLNYFIHYLVNLLLRYYMKE